MNWSLERITVFHFTSWTHSRWKNQKMNKHNNIIEKNNFVALDSEIATT